MKKEDIIQIGKEVLNIEANAVKTLASSLDENFFKAVQLIFSKNSRVIVTGMGKSGLIGRKIAATLASCGTPAIFIHPAEAGHGDLGVIRKEDVLLAISYSGETREICYLLDFVKRIGVKLISITGEKNSKLAKYSDIVLESKVEKEAEPIGLIPTASSTAALALGDALAIALMKKRGFSEKDFAFFHPRGQAGKKLLKVSNLTPRPAAAIPRRWTDPPGSAGGGSPETSVLPMSCPTQVMSYPERAGRRARFVAVNDHVPRPPGTPPGWHERGVSLTEHQQSGR